MVTQHLALGDNCCNRIKSYHNENNNNNKCAFENRVSNRPNKFRWQNCIENRTRSKCVNCEMKYSHNLSTSFRILLIVFGLILALINAVAAVQGAAVYSNINFLANPNFEQICSPQQEHYIESDGKESSLILEFAPGILGDKRKLCTRILSAPTNYGFIVRLILPKIRRNRHGAAAGAPPSPTTSAESAISLATKSPVITTSTTTQISNEAIPSASAMSMDGNLNETKNDDPSQQSVKMSLIDRINATVIKQAKAVRSCPLSIFSSLDFHTPQWRLDPCLMEDTAPEMEDPVRLFHGRVRIVWEHGHHTLHSKLMVTALGKGDQCRSENKHQCLRIGDEPILCISKELVCDGIRHCPISNEYDSDEDYDMCWKRRRFGDSIPPAMETDIFEHFALEVFRNLFAFDVPSYDGTTTATGITLESSASADGSYSVGGGGSAINSTTLRKVESKQLVRPIEYNSGKGVATEAAAENTTESTFGHHRRNSTRSGLNSDLSKYGPWGYLMLGMLLCGGALLICGLWASASQHAATNEREATMQINGTGAGSDLQSANVSPPNYEELDPPPAYSVLFPNQKAASSTTLSSLGAAALMPPTITAVAVTTPNGTLMVNGDIPITAGTPATTTTAREIAVTASSSSSSTSSLAAGAAPRVTTTRVHLENVAGSSSQQVH